jgi:cytochrome c
MVKYGVLLCVVIAAGLCSFSFYRQDNHIPVVEITEPLNGGAVTPGGILTYKINVTDKEDGTSKYEEITPVEVFLKVKYLASEKDMAAYQQKEKQLEQAFILMKQNGCLNCHSLQHKLAGPSFNDIATKYGATPATYEKLSEKIIKGSHGVWGDGPQMPAHPHLKKEEAIGLARLVIQYGSDKNLDIYTGTEGAIQLNKSQGKISSAVLLLIASYLDHGIEMENRKDGKAMVKIFLK